jgi:hypothetical protein
MTTFAFLALFANSFSQANGPIQPKQTEKFVWRYGVHSLGALEVPTGFTAETENYREGIVTRLRYKDGSCLVLQRGFMYRIPMFQDREHIQDSSQKMSTKTVRRGHYAGRAEVWAEVDYAARKPVHPGASVLELVSPNIGYEHVPHGRRTDFAKALESFVLEP